MSSKALREITRPGLKPRSEEHIYSLSTQTVAQKQPKRFLRSGKKQSVLPPLMSWEITTLQIETQMAPPVRQPLRGCANI